MKYVISYYKTFDKDGTCYRQRVRLSMSVSEFAQMNDEINMMSRTDRINNYFLRPLTCGVNYTTCTTANFVRKFIGAENDPRFKDDRNSVVELTLTDWADALNKIRSADRMKHVLVVGSTCITDDVHCIYAGHDTPKWVSVHCWGDSDGRHEMVTFPLERYYEMGMAAAKAGIGLKRTLLIG